jgi:hypothetical protein
LDVHVQKDMVDLGLSCEWALNLRINCTRMDNGDVDDLLEEGHSLENLVGFLWINLQRFFYLSY